MPSRGSKISRHLWPKLRFWYHSPIKETINILLFCQSKYPKVSKCTNHKLRNTIFITSCKNSHYTYCAIFSTNQTRSFVLPELKFTNFYFISIMLLRVFPIVYKVPLSTWHIFAIMTNAHCRRDKKLQGTKYLSLPNSFQKINLFFQLWST